ncbi:LLM class F420-dependent oxidoreductase [Desertimonas flava]|uniref:LLM class F420-dependent oxidoreductase n=1 Tax=Desertimonas flava TaxID=2064846 RepID=UPI001D0CA6D0|nr:LLM class F420-dependent oxidoreductase [Desertimonas flava]
MMDFGLVTGLTDLAPRPGELAAEAEARGYTTLFLADHTHIPSSTPYNPRVGDLPTDFSRLLDPFCALTEAAAATTSIRLGTGICLVAQRDPIVLAKQVATIDYLSGGRFIFGVGYGWNEAEMRQHGVEPRHRRRILREKVLAMKEIWTNDEASFHGEFVHIEPFSSWPKPVQRPHPPIWLGGSGPTAFAHIAEFADGWFPPAGGVTKHREQLEKALAEHGRDVGSVTFAVNGPRPSVEAFRHYEAHGATHVTLMVPAERDEAFRELDRLDEIVAAYRAG